MTARLGGGYEDKGWGKSLGGITSEGQVGKVLEQKCMVESGSASFGLLACISPDRVTMPEYCEELLQLYYSIVFFLLFFLL